MFHLPDFHLLGPSISMGFGTSSLTEARPGSPLQYMSWRPHTSYCVLPGYGSVSESPQGSALVETAGLSMGSSFSSVSSSLSLIYSQGSPMSVHCLDICICMYLSQQLVGPPGGQSCQVLVCEHSIALVIG